MKYFSSFAFKNTIAAEVLDGIRIQPKSFLNSTITDIEAFVDTFGQDPPLYILGLGEYTGRDQNKLRIETSCTNKFRNRYISGDQRIKKDIPYFLHTDIFKYTQGIGNSFCNLISYHIIQLSLPSLHYTFIHIPRSYNKEMAIKDISASLSPFFSDVSPYHLG